jgi:hypothetical protein
MKGQVIVVFRLVMVRKYGDAPPPSPPLPLMEVIHQESVKAATRLRPNCEPSRTVPTARPASFSSQRHVQAVLFERQEDDVVDVAVTTDTDMLMHPAVGMSENLGILPGGYFAQLLAKRSR